MNDAQYRRERNLIKEFVPQSMRQSQISEGDAEGDVEVDGVTDIPSTRMGSKPSGESPEPFQNRFKDFDVPSLTNGSSCGSRTPSVTTDSEHSSAGLDIPSRDQEDLWPTLNPAMPCSSDPQAITESFSPESTHFVSRDSNEAIGSSPQVSGCENLSPHDSSTRGSTTTIITASNHQHGSSSITGVRNILKSKENTDEEKGDADSTGSEGVDDYNDDDEDSNDSWSLHICILEAAVLEAFRVDLDLAAFFLSNLNEVLGLHNSRDISKQKVTSWIPGIKSSPNSSETSSRQTRSSYGSQATSDSAGQNGKRQRCLLRKGKEGEGDHGEDEEAQGERNPKKFKGSEPRDKCSGDPLLACPFWKLNPKKYNAQYHPDANGRRGKYRTCEGPGFTDIQRLKEHLGRVHIHVQCQRCGTVFDGSDHAIRAKRLEEHQRLEIPCQLKPEIIKEGINDTQWANITKPSNKKTKRTSCPLPKTTVEKWNEIWAILFVDTKEPSNPWHPREYPQTQFLDAGGSPVGNFQKLLEAALHLKVNKGIIQMNDLTLSRIVDVATQTFVLALSPGIQDLNLGTSSGLHHSSDYGSFLGGSYLDVMSLGGATIGDQNVNQLPNHDTSSQGTDQIDLPHETRTVGPPAVPAEQMYASRIDHNSIPASAVNSGAMGQFQDFDGSSMMQGTASGQFISPFPASSFDNNYRIDGDVSYSMPMNTFYHNGPQSFGAGNQNNPGQVHYQQPTTIIPSTATQYRNLRESCRSPHDQRR